MRMVDRLYEIKNDFISKLKEGKEKRDKQLTFVPIKSIPDRVLGLLEREICFTTTPTGAGIEFAGNINYEHDLAKKVFKALLVRAEVVDANEEVELPHDVSCGGMMYEIDDDRFPLGWCYTGYVLDSEYVHTVDPRADITAYDPEHFQQYANSIYVKVNNHSFKALFDEYLIELDMNDPDLEEFQNENDLHFDDILDDIRQIISGIHWVSSNTWRGAYSSPPEYFEAFGKKWNAFDNGFTSLDGFHGDKPITQETVDNMEDVIMVFTRTSNVCATGVDIYTPSLIK